MPKISVVISLSSLERCFLQPILRECAQFAAQIVISVGTHLHDGKTQEPEDFLREVLLAAGFYSPPPSTFVKVCQYQVAPQISLNPLRQRPGAFWHNISRINGLQGLDAGTEWVLFLDADEIPDGARMRHWATVASIDEGAAYKFGCHWYYRSPCYQATSLEDSPVLVHHRHLSPEALMVDNERDGTLGYCGLRVVRMVGSIEDPPQPMFHHFSFVRPLPQLLEKVKVWGHAKDEAWTQMIEESFARPFDGTDPVHGYEYTEVPNRFGIVV